MGAISNIRSSSPTNPGLAPHEISFLRLLDSITNGTTMQISYTGTKLIYNPGGKKRTGIGFGLSLIAETSAQGVIYSADVPAPSEGGVTPEDVGKQCAYQLLEVISQGGCFTRVGSPTVLTLMAMG